MSLKGLTLYEGPKSMEKRPLQSLPKVEKMEHLMAQLKPKPFQTSYHATQGKPQLLFFFFGHNITASNPLSRALHHPYLGVINKTEEIGKCSKCLMEESEDHKF